MTDVYCKGEKVPEFLGVQKINTEIYSPLPNSNQCLLTKRFTFRPDSAPVKLNFSQTLGRWQS